MGTYISRFAFWNPGTWNIPTLYWDAFSEEQRIHAICKQLGKVIAYADYLGINVDDIAARLKAIEEGQITPIIEAAVEEWFEEHQEQIVGAITDLEDALPIADYDAEHTVSDAINAVSSIIPASEFDSVNTVKAAIDNLDEALQDTISELESIKAGDVLLIGDSYLEGASAGFTPSWVTWLRNSLPDSTVYNYGDRGSGFVHKGNTNNTNFLDQTNNAIANITDKNKVSHILVYGGLNDAANNESTTTVRDNAEEIATKLANNFKKATIVFCIPNASIRFLFNDEYEKLLQYANFIRIGVRTTQKAIRIIDATYWLAVGDDSYLSDNIHPSNNAGNKILLNNVCWALFGIGEPYYNYGYITGVASAIEGTWIEEVGNRLARIKNGNGEITIPDFFVKLTSANYYQLTQTTQSPYMDLTNCISLNGAKNPVVLMRGTWNTSSNFYDFKVVFNLGTQHVSIVCMNNSMPASLPSGTHYIWFWGIKKKIGHTSN